MPLTINETQFTLKDGRTAILRSPRYEDIEGLLEYLYITAGETEFVLRYPEECGKYTYEGEKAIIDRFNASDREAMILCIVDGVIAGVCDIRASTNIKTRHRAAVAIAQRHDFWNLGIGTKMFEELIRIAESLDDVIQMELEVIEGNDRARHLYEKMGFRIAGIHPNAIRLKNGTLLNVYLMIKELKR
ncbi:MAG TPA: GNAT family N-acetyltransferase [Bacillota bacterium]|nr:GNAT family N-acetyltransferase [Bacillota bacterium]